MHLFSAAKKEITAREAAIATVAKEKKEFIASLKKQTTSIAKLLNKLPSNMIVIEATDVTSTALTINWNTPSWSLVIDKSIAEAIELISNNSSPTEEKELECGILYEVRYFKTKNTMSSWIILKDLEQCSTTIKNILPNSSYTFELRANLYIQAKNYPSTKPVKSETKSETKEDTSTTTSEKEFKESSSSSNSKTNEVDVPIVPRCMSPNWSDWHGSTAISTISVERHERNEFDLRLLHYFDQTLQPYPPYVRSVKITLIFIF